MKKTRTRIFFIGSIFLLFVGAVSCSKTDKAALFQQKLSSIDSVIETGSTQKALDSLRSLRKKAQTPTQYLSIAKRELKLHTPVQALQSIQAGLKKHPEDTALKAALTHTLLHAQMIDDAAAAADALQGTQYAGIGTEAYIQADKQNKTYLTPVAFWQAGFNLTGEHAFLENAAVLLAHQGDIAAAAALRSKIGKKEALRSPYFWSCLAYDIGNFKPVLNDLQYSLAYADMAGIEENNPKAFEYARRHILLAADASAGLAATEQARGFWQMYIDRYPDSSSDVFYNLAMTAPTEEEKAEVLIACIDNDPGYYPVVAQYVRAYAAIKAAHAQQNALTEYLQSKDFFSLEMEKQLFVSSSFTLAPEEVLDNAMAVNKDDFRFLLENFRYRYALRNNYAQGSGEMWKLLEQYPNNMLIKAYARWYFASSGDFNACFGIDKTGNASEDAFYNAIRSAVQGYSTAALRYFAQAEADDVLMAAVFADQAYVYDARNEPDKAVQYFTRAANILSEKQLKGKMLYEAARIYATRNGRAEALGILNRVLELDPDNRRARVLKQQLNADSSLSNDFDVDALLKTAGAQGS